MTVQNIHQGCTMDKKNTGGESAPEEAYSLLAFFFAISLLGLQLHRGVGLASSLAVADQPPTAAPSPQGQGARTAPPEPPLV